MTASPTSFKGRACRLSSSRSEEHTSELQSHSEISYAVFCLKKKKDGRAGSAAQPGRRPGVRGGTGGGDSTVAAGCRFGLRFGPDSVFFFFFFNDTATTEIYTLSYTLSLHDALPI